jgi:hypothetical protein
MINLFTIVVSIWGHAGLLFVLEYTLAFQKIFQIDKRINLVEVHFNVT